MGVTGQCREPEQYTSTFPRLPTVGTLHPTCAPFPWQREAKRGSVSGSAPTLTCKGSLLIDQVSGDTKQSILGQVAEGGARPGIAKNDRLQPNDHPSSLTKLSPDAVELSYQRPTTCENECYRKLSGEGWPVRLTE
jgi:hypothetical protein